jgi:hypothetical protein
MGLIDRAFIISHPKYHAKNLELIVRILLDNDYPIDLIFNTIRERLRCLFSKQSRKQSDDTNKSDNVKTSWFTIPYLPNVSEKFNNILRNSDTRLSFFSLNKLRKFIKVQKDPLPSSAISNVVYKISCCSCNASYVGQTGRQIKTRVSEHKNHIRRNNPTPSVITDHRMQYNHDFDWNNVEILDHERYYYKRLVSEMLHIGKQVNGLNLQSDTECLHHAYLSVLDNL